MFDRVVQKIKGVVFLKHSVYINLRESVLRNCCSFWMIRRNSLVVEQWQKIHSHLLNMALTNDLLELGKDDHISVIFFVAGYFVAEKLLCSASIWLHQHCCILDHSCSLCSLKRCLTVYLLKPLGPMTAKYDILCSCLNWNAVLLPQLNIAECIAYTMDIYTVLTPGLKE